MARHHDRPHEVGVASLALLGVVLLIAALVVGGWSSGLMAVRPSTLTMRLPEAPALPRRGPDPMPIPLPKPGPGVAQGR